MGILVRSYTEDGYQSIPSVRLSDEEYGRGLQCFVPVCTDIAIIDRKTQTIYLAKRKTKPMPDWWWIGGRMEPHETKEEAAVRSFERETGLKLPQNRFQLATIFDYRYKDRAQTPQEIGCHTLGYTFVVELEPAELAFASSHLERHEYEPSAGLSPFNREQLIEKNVFPAILDLFDHVFSDLIRT